jgi:hypothetical protein
MNFNCNTKIITYLFFIQIYKKNVPEKN